MTSATKLFYLANARLPTEKAHGIQIMKMCEALARQGVAVELIVPRRLNPLKDDPFSFYGVEPNFTITKLWCLDLISLNIFGALGFWLESWTFFRAVKKYLRGQSRGVYYTRDLSLAYWLSLEFGPLYYEIHTLPDKPDYRYRAAWQKAKGIIVISSGLMKKLLGCDVSVEKILLARDAVDLKQFANLPESKEECRKKLGLPLEQKLVVYTGHLYKWKGAALLAEAVNLLSPNVHVYLVGGTPQDIKAFKKTHQRTNLHIVGWQRYQLMPFWHKAANVLVLPNSATTKIGSTYSSPLKLFEYMASGTPLVVADLPALREILKDWPAVYIKPDNSKDLSNGIAQALNSVTNFRPAPPLRLLDDYTWEVRAKSILNFISNS